MGKIPDHKTGDKSPPLHNHIMAHLVFGADLAHKCSGPTYFPKIPGGEATINRLFVDYHYYPGPRHVRMKIMPEGNETDPRNSYKK